MAVQVLAASETLAPASVSPACNTWEGTSELALAPSPPNDHAAQSARLRWAPAGQLARAPGLPGHLPGWLRRRRGRGAAPRGRARTGTRAPAPRPPPARLHAAALGTGIGASGRLAAPAGGDRRLRAAAEGPRAEGAGRSMGGPRAWALLCLGLLLPAGSAAWSVAGAQFSGRR